MDQIMKIFAAILSLFGMAASAQEKLSAGQGSSAPKTIGKLDPEDPHSVADFQFDLMQAQGLGKGAEVAKEFGFKSEASGEDAAMRILTYQAGNPDFGRAVSDRIASRTHQLMEQVAADPAAMARQYQS